MENVRFRCGANVCYDRKTHCLVPEAGVEGMRRRDFLYVLGSAAAAWPLLARAQKPSMPVIGFLCSASRAEWAPYITAFRNGLNEAGFTEGRDVVIEYRWADNHLDRLPALVDELIGQGVAAIFAGGGRARSEGQNHHHPYHLCTRHGPHKRRPRCQS